MLCSRSGNLECVKLLLEANHESLHSLEYRLRTPIYYAVFEGHVEIVRFLLDQGATVDQRYTSTREHTLWLIRLHCDWRYFRVRGNLNAMHGQHAITSCNALQFAPFFSSKLSC